MGCYHSSQNSPECVQSSVQRSAVKHSVSESVTVSITISNETRNGLTSITLQMKSSHTIARTKAVIANKLLVTREQLTLRLTRWPNTVLDDLHPLSSYKQWNLSELDMVVDITDQRESVGEYHIRVCYDSSHQLYLICDILTVNNFDTVKTVRQTMKDQMYMKLGVHAVGFAWSKSLIPHLVALTEVGVLLPLARTKNAACDIGEADEDYTKLSDDAQTLEDCLTLFQHFLELRVCLLYIEDDGVKHVHSVKITNEFETSYHTDYLLRVEYNTETSQLYSMVTDHYNFSVAHVLLTMEGYQILCGDKELHVLFYPPIIPYFDNTSQLAGSGYDSLLSEFDCCPYPAQCQIAKKVNDNPIIKEMVSVRDNSWEVIIKVLNFSDKMKKEIEDNSEDDHIRCADIVHRMYHHDSNLTWEFIELQVRKEDPKLADVIRTHMHT